MIILGIDPGYAILGYGVICCERTKMCALDYGVIETKVKEPFPERLEKLYRGMHTLLKTYRPEHIVFEELFFQNNAKTALLVGAGRGVTLLAAQETGMPLYEYTPMQIKLAVTGDGHADKKQVQQMVKLLLGLKSTPKPDDAADALGAAICHGCMSAVAAEEFKIK